MFKMQQQKFQLDESHQEQSSQLERYFSQSQLAAQSTKNLNSQQSKIFNTVPSLQSIKVGNLSEIQKINKASL